MSQGQLLILGAGGHAKGIIEIVRAQGMFTILGLTAATTPDAPDSLLDCPLLGDDTCIAQLVSQGIEHFIVGMGAVGCNDGRERLFNLGRQYNLTPIVACHPDANIAPSASIQTGAAVFAGAIIGPSSTLGHNIIINHGAIVDHDCTIEDHVHIATGACLSGHVHIGSGTHIGAGATVIQGISIGSKAVIAAGAVVVSDVPAGVTVMGVPASIR